MSPATTNLAGSATRGVLTAELSRGRSPSHSLPVTDTDNAPLDCPVFSELTSHKTLWRSKTTVGILGFGGVGRAMADHFAALGVNVIASDIQGPYTPLPAGYVKFRQCFLYFGYFELDVRGHT